MFLVICLLSFLPIQGSSKTFKIGTLDGFAPFVWRENGEAKGIDVEIVNEMCVRAQLDCEIEFYSWTRALDQVGQKKLDAVFPAYKTAERLAYADYLDTPLHISTFKIYVKNGYVFPFDSFADLHGKYLTTDLGFTISKQFDSAVANGLIKIYETDLDTAINLLLKDRIDGVVASQSVMAFHGKHQKNVALIEPLAKPVRQPEGSYFILAQKSSNQELKLRLNKIAAELMQEGFNKKAIAKYIP